MTCRADADSVLLLFTGEQGPTVVDLVKKNPAVALGVVLPRLLQKDEEWYAAHCPATTFAEHDSLHKNVARCLISYGSRTEIHVSYASTSTLCTSLLKTNLPCTSVQPSEQLPYAAYLEKRLWLSA